MAEPLDSSTGWPSPEDALAAARQRYHAGDLALAERICRDVLTSQPNDPQALYRLGMINLRAGVPGLAAAFISRALAFDPTVPSFHRALGDALRAAGKPALAENSLRRALEMAPDDARVLTSLGAAVMDQGRLTEALAIYHAAVELAPRNAHAHINLGCLLVQMGRSAEAVASFRRGMAIDPDLPNPHAGVLFAQHYLPADDPVTPFAEAKAWGVQYADPLARNIPHHRNERNPDRRLRVGYVSGDFQEHPVGRILQAVLPAHDSTEVEVFCYANRRCLGPIAARLSSAADHWRSLVHLGDEAAAAHIRADEIDILVNLSGHTAENRLLVFARKPAPVQALWLGYFDTTGMASIDYILADRFVCPPGAERFYVEKVARLPDSWFCYAPPDSCPVVSPPPLISRGYVTFGCLNNPSKVTPDVITLWATILHAIPDARLCLKYFGFDDPDVRAQFTRMFSDHGVSPERLTLLGRTSLGEHLVTYDQIDIALDPFPYNGGISTLDALWMGVPVVSLAGDRFVSRFGVSILATAGLEELITTSPAAYLQAAISLANDPHRLADYRARLRQRMAESPLCDGARFAKGLEAAYREMWRTWCRSQEP